MSPLWGAVCAGDMLRVGAEVTRAMSVHVQVSHTVWMCRELSG